MIVLGTWLERLANLRLCEEEGAGSGTPPPDAGLLGGNTGTPPPNDWRTVLPEDIRDEPSLQAIKTIPDLAKGYVHAQKLVGTDKLAKPQANWTPEQKAEFWNQIGRPKTAEEYKFGEFKLAEGVQIQDERLSAARSKFHELGLTNEQADGVMQYYVGVINQETETTLQAKAQSRQQGLQALQKEHGEKLSEVVDVANSALRSLGGEDLIKKLQVMQLDNDPQLVNLLYKVGKLAQEDDARGTGPGLLIPDATAARQRIDDLVNDPDFMQRLNNRTLLDKKTGELIVNHQQHQEALDEWNRLHALAYK